MAVRDSMLSLFGTRRALIGMVHVGALLGTPAATERLPQLTERAVAEARLLRDAGFHAVMLENMHDVPYVNRTVGPEITAAMAVITREIVRDVDRPVGIQILAGANRDAMAAALASGARFIRAEGFVFGHLADEGWIEASAGPLLRYRREIGAEQIRVLADIKKKHAAHAATADVDLVDTARAAEFFRADGVIVTGAATARAADPAEVQAVADGVGIPVFVGSGLTPENLARFARADGLIVGSSLKRDGLWSNPLDPTRVTAMAKAFEWLQEKP